MNLVAFSLAGHDVASCILKDGEVYEYLLEDRQTGIKNDNNIIFSVKRVFEFHERYGIDHIIIANGSDEAIEILKSILLKYRMDKIPYTLDIWDHHLFHAASGYYASGFDESICLVMDGWGADHRIHQIFGKMLKNTKISDEQIENLERAFANVMFLETTTIYEASGRDINQHYKSYLLPIPSSHEFCTYQFPDEFIELFYSEESLDVNSAYDIGIMYGTITRHLGWYRDECGKTMGLAAYGNYNPDLPEFTFDNKLYANMNLFHSHRAINLLNYPIMKHDGDFQKKADIAYKMQKCAEEAIVKRVRMIMEKSPDTKNLVFSGGVALNICANSCIKKEFPDLNVFIDPIAGDGCQAYGIAMHYYMNEFCDDEDWRPKKMETTYLGPRYNLKTLKAEIEYEVAKENLMSYN